MRTLARRWIGFDAALAPGATDVVSGTPLRVFELSSELLVLTDVGGQPSCQTLSAQGPQGTTSDAQPLMMQCGPA